MSTVIIMGMKNDCHAQHMLNACLQKGQEAFLFDTSDFPSQTCISWDPLANVGSLLVDRQPIRFDQIKSVFWSTISQPALGADTNTPVNQIMTSDSTSALRTFFDEPSIRWVNSWDAFDFHRIKPRQLALAAKLGAKIPKSYIGNSAEDILNFARQALTMICKPVYGGAHSVKVENAMLQPERLNRVLRYAPVTLQEYIEGTNIRTYVIGEQVFSAEIVSNEVDFRLQPEANHIPIVTPAPIAALSRTLCKAFSMQWTAIDWRRDNNGNYVFLEANPSPMFLYFEQATEYPITSRLVDILLH